MDEFFDTIGSFGTIGIIALIVILLIVILISGYVKASGYSIHNIRFKKAP